MSFDNPDDFLEGDDLALTEEEQAKMLEAMQEAEERGEDVEEAMVDTLAERVEDRAHKVEMTRRFMRGLVGGKQGKIVKDDEKSFADKWDEAQEG